jgi:uncharacterized protein (TIGR03000 family)
MSLRSLSLTLTILAALAAPTAAQAQIFGGFSPLGFANGYNFGGYPYGFGGYPYGFGGYGGYGGYGMPYGFGGYGNPYGFGGYPYGASVTTPTFATPVVYTVTTPRSGSLSNLADARVRPALWPAIPYRAASVEGNKAEVEVRVPTASAQVWFDGVQMQQTGTDRRFITPPLTGGSTYTFEIRCSWQDEAGKQHTSKKQIEVRPGGSHLVNFNATP